MGSFPAAVLRQFDDSGWDSCSPGWTWDRSEGERWFRKALEVPEEILGVPIRGSGASLRIMALAGIELYIDGDKADEAEYWFDGLFPLASTCNPGDSHVISMRSPEAVGWGHFNFAEIYFDVVEELLLELEIIEARADLLRTLSRLGKIGKDRPGAVMANRGIELDCSDLPDARLLAKDYDSGLRKDAGYLEDLTSMLVGHAHMDMNWLWDYRDTVDTCIRTFRTVDALMDEFPDFVFSQSQAAVYKLIEEEDPDLFETIRRRVGEGRWDVTASTWVEGDLNMASGESLVRQTTLALEYVEDRFGVTPRIAWCPDTFGHPVTYPQILRKCGVEYYYGHRCNRPEAEHLTWWESPDGSRVLVFNEGVTYNNVVDPRLTKYYSKMLERFDLPRHMVVFGVGDHGGGPTKRDLMNVGVMNSEKDFPSFRHAQAHEFYDAVRASSRIPVVREELNFVFEGCYTTHADIKEMNRRGEAMLYEAEVIAALAMTQGYAYPREQLVQAWHNVLFNQFHDLLDGSAIGIAYEHSHEIFSRSQAICEEILRAALPLLLPRESPGFSVFNQLAWERIEPVGLPVEDDLVDPHVVELPSGRDVPSQAMEGSLVFEPRLPTLGWAEYEVREGGSEGLDEGAPSVIEPSSPGKPYTLENQYYRLTVDPESGAINSLYDKRLGRELLSQAEPGNLLQICHERPHGMSAWRIGPISRIDNMLTGAEVSVSRSGEVQAAVRVKHRFGNSSLTQEIVLHRDTSRIDFPTLIDWQEIGGPDGDSPMLKVSFAFAHSASKCVREVPFGHVEYPTNGREVPSQTFLELPGEGFGVALLNDGKYGHDAQGNVLRLTLLRAAYDPDPRPDVGEHRLTYSLLPHVGSWKEAEVWKMGRGLNMPPRVVPGLGKDGSGSLLSMDGQGVDLASLKAADDGDGVVLRLVEMKGRESPVTLRPGWATTRATQCDLREKPIKAAAPIEDGRIDLTLHPCEILTLRLE